MNPVLEFATRFGLGWLALTTMLFASRLVNVTFPLSSHRDYPELRLLSPRLAYQLFLAAYSQAGEGFRLFVPQVILSCSMALGASLMVQFFSPSALVNFAWVFGVTLFGFWSARWIEIRSVRQYLSPNARE